MFCLLSNSHILYFPSYNLNFTFGLNWKELVLSYYVCSTKSWLCFLFHVILVLSNNIVIFCKPHPSTNKYQILYLLQTKITQKLMFQFSGYSSVKIKRKEQINGFPITSMDRAVGKCYKLLFKSSMETTNYKKKTTSFLPETLCMRRSNYFLQYLSKLIASIEPHPG